VLAARARIEPQLTADRAAVAAACPRPTAKALSRLCRRAHRLDDAAIVALSRLRVAAAHRYSLAVEAARMQFWHDVRRVPGERHVRADRPIPLLND
jgi:hypothetical protein